MTTYTFTVKLESIDQLEKYLSFSFKGRTTQNLTVLSTLFSNNPSVTYWKFESIYTVTNTDGIASGTGAVRFVMNTPPQNGTCAVDRTNGTTLTRFRITCSNWTDSDGIEGYTLYGTYISFQYN